MKAAVGAHTFAASLMRVYLARYECGGNINRSTINACIEPQDGLEQLDCVTKTCIVRLHGLVNSNAAHRVQMQFRIPVELLH